MADRLEAQQRAMEAQTPPTGPVESLALRSILPRDDKVYVASTGRRAAFAMVGSPDTAVVDPRAPSSIRRVAPPPGLRSPDPSRYRFVRDGAVVLDVDRWRLHALDTVTGAHRWDAEVYPQGSRHPVSFTAARDGDDVVVLLSPVGEPTELLRFDWGSGTLSSRIPLPDQSTDMAVATGRTYVLGLQEPAVFAYAADGSRVWKTELGAKSPAMTHIAASEHAIVATTQSGTLHVIEPTSGEVCYEHTFDRTPEPNWQITAAPRIAGGSVFGVRTQPDAAGLVRHMAFALDLATGHLRWQAPPVPLLEDPGPTAYLFADVDAFHVCIPGDGTLRSYHHTEGDLRFEQGLASCELVGLRQDDGVAEFVARLGYEVGNTYGVLARGGTPMPLRTVRVTGTVLDADGNPLVGATVLVHDQAVSTDASGTFASDVDARGGFFVRVRAGAHEAGGRTWVRLTPRTRYAVQLRLRPQPPLE